MNKTCSISLFFALIIACFAPLHSQEAQVQGTIQITTTPPDYSTWKSKRIYMQLKRENNNVAISSLLQPAATLGTVFFGAMAAIILTISVLSGGGRDNAKDLVRSVETFIRLVQAPFTLRYEKNKARDRDRRIRHEAFEKRNYGSFF